MDDRNKQSKEKTKENGDSNRRHLEQWVINEYIYEVREWNKEKILRARS
jgi:hypothetical protein